MSEREAKRIAVVTGGEMGIGRAIAEQLCDDGFNVFSFDVRAADSIHRLSIDELTSSSPTPVRVDVGDDNQIQAAVDRLVELFGCVDAAVNNAAISPKTSGVRTPPDETSNSEWDSVMRTNLNGPFYLARAVIPGMKRQEWGRIVNVSSMASRTGARLAGLAYGVSKAGLNGLTRTLAADLGGFGITVNSVTPGRIQTPMADGVSDEVNERLVASTPVGRVGEASEIGALVSYLCGQDAGFVTGATLDINGGAYMAP